MAITPVYVTIETADGTVTDQIRVLAIDKIMAEKTMSLQGWKWEDNPRAHSVMAYYAAKRTKALDFDNYDEFLNQLVDFALSNSRDGEDEDGEDPTPADTSAL